MLNQLNAHSDKTTRSLCSLFLTALLLAVPLGCDDAGPADAQTAAEAKSARELIEMREQLNQTVWRDETMAQHHEQAIVKVWNSIKDSANKLYKLAEAPIDSVTLGTVKNTRKLEHDVVVTDYVEAAPGEGVKLDREAWQEKLEKLVAAGWTLEMTDWHHASYDPKTGDSLWSINLYATHEQQQQHLVINAKVNLTWKDEPGLDGLPEPEHATLVKARVTERKGKRMFAPWMRIAPTEELGRVTAAAPLITYDLDGDGFSEIILAGANQVRFNKGGESFETEPLVHQRTWQEANATIRCAIIADFTNDGRADLICFAPFGRQPALLLYEGDETGRFTGEAKVINTEGMALTNVSVLTAGDVDGDNDLDLFAAQYKPPYQEGQFPTPFWDANDGYPSYLLRNDGAGEFTDITESAGLLAKRFRRVYSSSLVDIDDDSDLDLIVVADFAGVDLYENDGNALFTDVSDQVPERNTFGMAHTFDDFNADGNIDFYAIGMSSTTARRLEGMGLNRDGYEKHRKMRMKMGYGNRIYYGKGGGSFEIPQFNDNVARTGWSWGVSSFDMDNDGDREIYVANGHVSGESTKDYCTVFWCHDIYDMDSQGSLATKGLVEEVMAPLTQQKITWDGYQKNVLFKPDETEGYANIAYPMGLAFVFDARAVVTEDLDNDGRVDVLVTQEKQDIGSRTGQVLYVSQNQVDGGNWIGFRLREHGKGYSPVGAKVEIDTPAGTRRAWLVTGDSFRAQHANTAHFGLGEVDQVSEARVYWPNGEVTTIASPAAGQYHAVMP